MKKTIVPVRQHRLTDTTAKEERGEFTPKIAANWQEMVKRSLPSLLEPDVWTGKTKACALEPMRKKQAEIHRGSRRRYFGPLKEAGYTSAIVITNPDPTKALQSGWVHIRPHMTPPGSEHATPRLSSLATFRPYCQELIVVNAILDRDIP